MIDRSCKKRLAVVATGCTLAANGKELVDGLKVKRRGGILSALFYSSPVLWEENEFLRLTYKRLEGDANPSLWSD